MRGVSTILLPLQASAAASLQNNSAQADRNFAEFWQGKTLHILRLLTTSCDFLPLQHKKQSHISWNCRNSAAVMFELHCSEFEFRCSKSAHLRVPACSVTSSSVAPRQ